MRLFRVISRLLSNFKNNTRQNNAQVVPSTDHGEPGKIQEGYPGSGHATEPNISIAHIASFRRAHREYHGGVMKSKCDMSPPLVSAPAAEVVFTELVIWNLISEH